MANALPYEIWECITNQLSDNDVYPLLGVNRLLFYLVLERKYGDVSWFKLDKETVQILQRLQEPSIAACVKRLHIRAWFISYLLKRRDLHGRPASSNSISIWFNQMILRRETKVKHPSTSAKLTPQSSPRYILNAMTKAVQGMTRLVEYEFEWRDLPMDANTIIYLSTAKQAFGQNLHKLVLHAQVSRLQQFLTITDFQNLEELVLTFDHKSDRELNPHDESKALVESVAPFINNIHKTLRVLSVSSSTSTDISPFINALSGLSLLEAFHLRVDLLHPPVSDNDFLGSFLHRHAHLQGMHVRSPAQYGWQGTTHNWAGHWVEIFKPCITQPHALRNFIALTLPALEVPKLLSILQYSTHSLRKLALFGRYMPESEVRQIVHPYGADGSLGHELKDLTVEVETMSLKFISYLSTRLANLRRLTLIVKDYEGMYPREMYEQNPAYPNWQLEHLTLYKRRMGEWQWQYEDWEIMRWVGDGIPYIKTLKGVPYRKGLVIRVDPSYGMSNFD
ncbi:hypothetical protein AX16_001864 [Volvariella volvacea WC 439]|nr:hypothetical protein AX16_001864 [Volvariella volvacea WC 439]